MTVPAAHLREQLVLAHSGDPWHGPSRKALLRGLRATDAAAHPIPGAHSIWEVVLHMSAWTREVARRLRGAAPAQPAEGDWPAAPEPSEAKWAGTLAELDAAHADVRSALEAIDPARLDRAVGEEREPALGTGFTAAGMVAGLAQHDAYHCGQIALLKRALGGSG